MKSAKAQSIEVSILEMLVPTSTVEDLSVSRAQEAPTLMGELAIASVIDDAGFDPVVSNNRTWYGSSSLHDALEELPMKNEQRGWRRLRHLLFAVYERLFSLVIVSNTIVLVTLLATNRNSFSLTLSNVADAASANLLAAVLVRQEYFVNLLFYLARLTPTSAPFRLRTLVAKVYHYGGIHSGCAIACTMWFLLFAFMITREWLRGDFASLPAVILTYLLVVELVAICAFAVPRLRMVSHNSFENVHRLAGWSSLVLFWILVPLLTDSVRTQTGNGSLGLSLAISPTFWFVLATTLFIVRPWLDLRYIEAHPEYLSNHAIRLRFKDISNIPGSAVRITDAPLKEWHAFACISNPDSKTCSLVVSNAGDWTRQQIAHPARRYYIRGIPTAGVISMATIFKKVVMVATGSGIGPVLAVTLRGNVPHRILWSTPSPLQTFGRTVMAEVMVSDPNAVIIDTRIFGRPDMVRLAYIIYVRANAEAVFIISNPSLTRKMVYGLESRGIPAYGPIWDS